LCDHRRQLLHEEIVVFAQSRDCGSCRLSGTRTNAVSLPQLRPLDCTQERGEQVKVLSADVHCQARPEYVQSLEALVDVTLLQCGEKRGEQFIQFRMIVAKQLWNLLTRNFFAGRHHVTFSSPAAPIAIARML
jgi:hypothetical protein